MDFLTPLAFLGGLLAIPIILLYMLRLRRREVLISSTFLWRQVLQDQEANTPWQRLRRNLLLLLQLLIVLLLVLALARPFMIVPAVSAHQITVLLDASASMNATDSAGKTRFDDAQDKALNIVDTLRTGHRMTVIRVAGVPEVLISSSNESNLLRAAIRDARPSMAEADWEAALNLAAGSGTGTEDFTIVIIGDGGLPETAGLPGISGELRYIPVGSSGENLAMTALATRALPGQTPQLYAQITNYGLSDAQVIFSLMVDGRLFASSNQTIPAQSNLPMISSALPETFRTLQATLTQPLSATTSDHLTLDDTAYTVFGAQNTRQVLLVTSGNVYLEQVLRSLPGLEIVRTDGATGIPEAYDLYVFDSFIPQRLPEGDLLFINPPGSVPGVFTLGESTSATGNIRIVDETDMLMRFVDVRQLNLLRFHPVTGPAWARPFITADGGTLLLAGDSGERQVVVMPFDLRESDLPLQITWPVLMANMLEWFTPRASIVVADSVRVGSTVVIHPHLDADRVRIVPPESANHAPYVLPIEQNTVIFTETRTPGIYMLELLQGETVIEEQPFAVNLFSPLESDIAPVAEADLKIEGTTIKIPAQEEIGQEEFWPVVLLLAVLLLVIEWYAYHRRLRIPTLFRPVSTPAQVQQR